MYAVPDRETSQRRVAQRVFNQRELQRARRPLAVPHAARAVELAAVEAEVLVSLADLPEQAARGVEAGQGGPVAAVALSASAAFGADLKLAKAPPPPPPPPSPWDIAFGGAIMSDYIWRGVTQSGHAPSVAAYTELRYNAASWLQFYGGISAESIQFPNRAAA